MSCEEDGDQYKEPRRIPRRAEEESAFAFDNCLARFSEEIAKSSSIVLTGDVDIDKMILDCVSTISTKGKEYTGGSIDRLTNFRGVAADVGIKMEEAWYVFANKHWRAIQSYIKNDCQVQSEESIQGRIMDVIVYMLLFSKMAKEIEDSRTLKGVPEGKHLK